MIVSIVKDFIPVGRRNRPGNAMVPKFITIHDTANTRSGADAKAHAAYLKSAAAQVRGASWHFTVDDKVIYQHLPLNENGWHAGDGRNGPGNRTSIGIEICENKDGNRAKAEANAAWLTAKLLKDHGLGIEAVVQHHHWTRKNCPRVLRGRRGGWTAFLATVRNHMVETRREVPPATLKHTVVRGDTLYGIAKQHWVSLRDLMLVNPQISNPDRIQVGDVVYVPQRVTPPEPVATPATPTPAPPEAIVPVTEQQFWTVQVGKFADRKNAEMVAMRLKQAGYDTFIRTTK